MSGFNFANPKVALGFAGLVVGVALFASFSADLLLPASEPEEPVVTEEVAVKKEAGQPAPAPQKSAWDGNGLADSWGTTPNGQQGAASRPDKNRAEKEAGGFGDYSPQGQNSPSQSSKRSNGSGPAITSGAAPGAPALSPPD